MFYSHKNKGLGYLEFNTNGTIVGEDDGDQRYELKDVVLMQYTGLKDKNGKEIYEGDVIKCNPHWSNGDIYEVGVITWEKQRAGFMVNVGRLTVQGFKSLKMGGASHKEVIGNIYENPELIK